MLFLVTMVEAFKEICKNKKLKTVMAKPILQLQAIFQQTLKVEPTKYMILIFLIFQASKKIYNILL